MWCVFLHPPLASTSDVTVQFGAPTTFLLSLNKKGRLFFGAPSEFDLLPLQKFCCFLKKVASFWAPPGTLCTPNYFFASTER